MDKTQSSGSYDQHGNYSPPSPVDRETWLNLGLKESDVHRQVIDYGKLYTAMHEDRPKLFAGDSLLHHVDAIAELVRETGAKTLLDYGSGKGFQYLAKRAHEAWGGILPVCYDVGVRQLSERPAGTFSGVICTDVLEHIAEEDVDGVLADIFSYAESFVFLAISCRPAKKFFPDGRNVHLTVKEPGWWDRKINRLERPGFSIQVSYDLP